MKILCSTGAMGGYGFMPEAEHISDMLGLLDADGMELMLSWLWARTGYPWYEKLRPHVGRIMTTHLQKSIGGAFSSGDTEKEKEGLRQLRLDVEGTGKLGVKRAVLHLWGWPDSNFSSTMRLYKESLKIAADNGVELLVETLPCIEATLMDRMHKVADVNPDVHFTADCRMLCHQSFEKAIFDEKWLWDEGRITHVHVSDCLPGEDGKIGIHPILHPGEGVIDFPAFMGALKEKGYDGCVTLESPGYVRETRSVRIDKVNASLRYIKQLSM